MNGSPAIWPIVVVALIVVVVATAAVVLVAGLDVVGSSVVDGVEEVVTAGDEHAASASNTTTKRRLIDQEYVCPPRQMGRFGSTCGTSFRMKTDEELWSEFLSFIPNAPSAGSPLELFEGFEQHLLATGSTLEEASADRLRILGFTNHRRDWIGPMFDRIYTSDTPDFRQTPNRLLTEVVASVSPGTALDIAMGQGRNAVFLATIGWEVTGIDVSPQGIAVAEEEANRAGVTIEAIEVGFEDFDLGQARWDLIVLTYALVPVVDRESANQIIESMTTNGLLVIESFGSDRSGRGRRPVDIEPDQLREAYKELEVIRFDDVDDIPEWTNRSTRVVRMVARKAG